eukprot:scaffold6758_cov56-Phaeocystis_antarctica.AAC.4
MRVSAFYARLLRLSGVAGGFLYYKACVIVTRVTFRVCLPASQTWRRKRTPRDRQVHRRDGGGVASRGWCAQRRERRARTHRSAGRGVRACARLGRRRP